MPNGKSEMVVFSYITIFKKAGVNCASQTKSTMLGQKAVLLILRVLFTLHAATEPNMRGCGDIPDSCPGPIIIMELRWIIIASFPDMGKAFMQFEDTT